jgi:hypothetical protein
MYLLYAHRVYVALMMVETVDTVAAMLLLPLNARGDVSLFI